MPSRNVLKQYLSQGLYHIYNRGVEKRNIFIDEQDYGVFLHYLKLYLLLKEDLINELKHNNNAFEEISRIKRIKNYHLNINLFCYVLMPNHFHLLLRQKEKYDIEGFMRSVITKYVLYFNHKYNRVGPLFQGRYKAILVNKEQYLLYLSRYIHRNPIEILPKKAELSYYPWSSYPIYLNKSKLKWVNKDIISRYFLSVSKYKNYVEDGTNKEEISDELHIDLS